MSNTPAISVIIPVYNTASYLAECLDSILVAQTFRDFVVLCCDDCSTDESSAILARYAERYPQQIKIIRHEQNRGLSSALNTLIRAVETPYITFCDSDDVAHPDRLRRVFEFMEQNTDIDILGSWCVFFQDKVPPKNQVVVDHPYQDHAMRSLLLLRVPLTGATATIRTASLRAADVWQDERLTGSAANDYDFFVRLAPYFRFASIPEPLYYYRVHEQQMSTAGYVGQLESILRIAQRHLAQFGVRVSKNALRVLYRPPSTALFQFYVFCVIYRKERKKLLKDIEGITDFYGYPCVSADFIRYIRATINYGLGGRVVKFPFLLYESIVARYPCVRRVMKRYPIIQLAYRIARVIYRALRGTTEASYMLGGKV